MTSSLLYVESLWKLNKDDPYTHDWWEAPDEAAMFRNMKRMAERHNKASEADREEMKLRIRDTFRTYRTKLTSVQALVGRRFTPTT